MDPLLLARVEDAGINASAPSQQRWMDGWLLRFSPGKAKRARCVNAVAPGRWPLEQKLRWCEQVFTDAGLPLIVRITPMTQPPELDTELAARGLRRFDDTRVMVLPELTSASPPQLPAEVSLRSVGLEAFASHVGELRKSPLSQRQAHGHRLTHSPVPFHAVELHLNGKLASCGQMALEADLVGLYDIYTAPEARGKGLARLLCQHLLAHAKARGARHAYLQVEADNAAARSIYSALGFSDAYAYHYRTADPDAA